MSTYFPKSLKNKVKSSILYTRQSLFKPKFRPEKSIFETVKVNPVLHRGYPVFDTIFDTLNRKASGLRKYKVKAEKLQVKTDYNIENYHEMNHRFRFELNEKAFESELQSHCNQLFLVGWIKCRRKFSIGHLQGNVISTSQMKRWMEICCTKHAKFSRVFFFDENYAIPKLDYSDLTVVRDYRKPHKKQQHEQSIKQKLLMSKLLT